MKPIWCQCLDLGWHNNTLCWLFKAKKVVVIARWLMVQNSSSLWPFSLILPFSWQPKARGQWIRWFPIRALKSPRMKSGSSILISLAVFARDSCKEALTSGEARSVGADTLTRFTFPFVIWRKSDTILSEIPVGALLTVQGYFRLQSQHREVCAGRHLGLSKKMV